MLENIHAGRGSKTGASITGTNEHSSAAEAPAPIPPRSGATLTEDEAQELADLNKQAEALTTDHPESWVTTWGYDFNLIFANAFHVVSYSNACFFTLINLSKAHYLYQTKSQVDVLEDICWWLLQLPGSAPPYRPLVYLIMSRIHCDTLPWLQVAYQETYELIDRNNLRKKAIFSRQDQGVYLVLRAVEADVVPLNQMNQINQGLPIVELDLQKEYEMYRYKRDREKHESGPRPRLLADRAKESWVSCEFTLI